MYVVFEFSITCNAPLHGDGQLPRPRHRLDDDVGLGDTAGLELPHRPLQQRLDDAAVPPGVDDADAQAAAVVLLRRGAINGMR